ncbi:MAG TPA: HIT family protein [Patescibacteria group bacterium]|nr:HIT family protein [Patescibacteria group bacterium]
MEDCIFCKIIKGEIPADKVYEDDRVLAFLDISPINKGHILVVPKEHFENLLETPDELVEKLVLAGKKIGLAVREVVRAEGINVGINNGSAAGQVVFHTHIHIIPRFSDDGYKLWGSDKKYELGEGRELAQKIQEQLNN